MKSKISMHVLFLPALFLLLAAGCKKESAPVLSTAPVTYVSTQSVTCSGSVTDEGSASVTDKGICWSTSHNPTTAGDKISAGSGTGTFTCTVTDLMTNMQYYIRAYAVSSAGTGYGPEIPFRTWNTELAHDVDGNIYHTVTIGAQVWMVENLRTSHYSTGIYIPYITDNAEWEGQTSGAFCDYENDPANVPVYGRLYNWFAVNNSSGLAPAGWHVASDAEWTLLTSFLGGEATAGGKLKEAGLVHWLDPNTGATNETGFSALPGGHREYGGNFDYQKWGGGWWTSTEANSNDAVIRYMDCGNKDVWRYLEDKRYGRSVRCVKD